MLNDITETGKQTYKELQEENESSYNKPRVNLRRPDYVSNLSETPEKSPLMASGDYYGRSRFDPKTLSEGDWEDMKENPNEMRALNQGWVSKFTSGIGKAAILAGTTFIDGNLGFIYGIGSAALNGKFSNIWNNEFSDFLADINKQMEDWLPNYKSTEEENMSLWQKMSTANFWADSIIKNAGFAVGAMYSGNAWLGALKALGVVKKAMTAKAIGSTLSAINEARIEANNNSADYEQLQVSQIEDKAYQRIQEIQDSKEIPLESKQAMIDKINQEAEVLKKDAADKADKMGATVFAANSVLLPLSNFIEFARIYARGMKESGSLAKKIVKGEAAVAAEEAGKDIVKDGSKYGFKKGSMARVAGRSLLNAATEGNEEMAQAFISEYAGQRQSPDSPDAYYNALVNEDANIKTQDFLTSAAKGFSHTYGDGAQWEQFVAGAIMGGTGMITFGKTNNSSANTYLGKGKAVGMSGGIFGEIRQGIEDKRNATEAVSKMNDYVDKIQTQKNYFVRNQAFTDAMDGYTAADDKFEFKNSQENGDFNAIAMFSRTGRLEDLKEMIKQDYEGMTDEALDDIAKNTTPYIDMKDDGTINTKDATGKTATSGWRNEDGSLMSSTEEGREKMREKLIAKRDKMLKEIDKYNESVKKIRGIGMDVLSEDQVDELAWLQWKTGSFNDRFTEVKDKQKEFIGKLKETIDNEIRNSENLQDEESKKKTISLHSISGFLTALQESKSPLEMGLKAQGGKEIIENLKQNKEFFREHSAVDSVTLDSNMIDLEDLAKLGVASTSFNERLTEFAKDPLKVKERRKKKEEKLNNAKKTSDNLKQEKDVKDSSVSDIIGKVDRGEVDLDEIEEALQNLNQGRQTQQGVGKNGEKVPEPNSEELDKVREAKKVINTAQQVIDSLRPPEEPPDSDIQDIAENGQAYKDAITLVAKARAKSESVKDVTDLSGSVYIDPDELLDENDPNIKDMSEDEKKAYLTERLDRAKTLLQPAIDELDSPSVASSQELEEFKKSKSKGTVVRTFSQPTSKETGKDSVEKVTTANQVQEAKKQESEAEAKAATNPLLYNNSVGSLISGIDGFDKLSDTDKDSVRNGIENVVKTVDSYLANYEKDYPIEDFIEFIKNTLTKNGDSAVLTKKLDDKTIIDKLINKYIALRKKVIEDEEAEKNAQQQAEKDRLEAVRKSAENPQESNPIVGEPTVSQDAQDTDNQFIEEDDEPTNYATDEDLNNEAAREATFNDGSSNTMEVQGKSYNYGKPLTTEYPIHPTHGDGRTTGKIVEEDGGLKLQNGQINKYSPELKQKIIAVHKYLTEQGAYEKVNNGDVQVGSTIRFAVDKQLNKDSGDFVVLMTDENGNVIGDLGSEGDNNSRYKELIGKIKTEYEKVADTSATNLVVIDKIDGKDLKSTVNGNMIGKVPYSIGDKLTINEVFADPNSPEGVRDFKLGITIRTENKEGNKEVKLSAGKNNIGLSESVMAPTRTIKGRPYLLLPTSDKGGEKQYIPVSFTMARYTKDTKDTLLGQAVTDIFNQIQNNSIEDRDAKNWLVKLFNVGSKKIQVDYDGANKENVTIKISPYGSNDYVTVYSGARKRADGKNLADAIEGNIFSLIEKGIFKDGIPFRIANSLINKKYTIGNKIVSYNKMIGEIAKVNLPQGATHTINDWFTFNPIDKEGNEIIGDAPKTLGYNPYPASSKSHNDNGYVLTTGGNQHLFNVKMTDGSMRTLYVIDDTTSGTHEFVLRLYSKDGKTYKDYKDGEVCIHPSIDNKYRAYVFGLTNRFSMNTVYNTNWGVYDPIYDNMLTTQFSVDDKLKSAFKGYTLVVNPALVHSNKLIRFNAGSNIIEFAAKDYNVSIIIPIIINSLKNDTFYGETYLENLLKDSDGANLLMTLYASNYLKSNNSLESMKKAIESLKAIRDYENKNEDKRTFKEGTRIYGIDISGMTLEQATNLFNSDNTKQEITIKPIKQGEEKIGEAYDVVNIIAGKEKNILGLGVSITIDDLGGEEDEGIKSYSSEVESMRVTDTVKNLKGEVTGTVYIKFKDRMGYVKYPSVHLNNNPLENISSDTQDAYRAQITNWLQRKMDSQNPTNNFGLSMDEIGDPKEAQQGIQKIIEDKQKGTKQTPTMPTSTSNVVGDIVGAPSTSKVSNDSTTKSEPSTTKPSEELDKSIDELGLLEANKDYPFIWKTLTNEQKSFILELKEDDIGEVLKKLKVGYNRKTNVISNDTLKSVFSKKGLNRVVSSSSKRVFNREREMKWLGKVLPQLASEDRIRIVDGLIKLKGNLKVYGRFENGIITISSKAAEGTVFHEAFHSVVHTILSDTEKILLFRAAESKWGTKNKVELEENLAEDFRKYTQLEQTPVVGVILKFFRKIKHVVDSLSGRENYIRALYYNINNGKYSNLSEEQTSTNLNKKTYNSLSTKTKRGSSIINSLSRTGLNSNLEFSMREDLFNGDTIENIKNSLADLLSISPDTINITSSLDNRTVNLFLDNNTKSLLKTKIKELSLEIANTRVNSAGTLTKEEINSYERGERYIADSKIIIDNNLLNNETLKQYAKENNISMEVLKELPPDVLRNLLVCRF